MIMIMIINSQNKLNPVRTSANSLSSMDKIRVSPTKACTKNLSYGERSACFNDHNPLMPITSTDAFSTNNYIKQLIKRNKLDLSPHICDKYMD